MIEKTAIAKEDEDGICPKRSDFMRENLPHLGNFYCPYCSIKRSEKKKD